MIVIAIHLLVLLSYALLVGIFILGWRRTPTFERTAGSSETADISVVVACKNEATQLPQLLKQLKEQSHQNFELILINDHSKDATGEIMERALSDFQRLKMITAEGEGKKNALKQGILQAQGSLIVTTDADCRPHPGWLATLLDFQAEQRCDLIIGPVQTKVSGTLFSKLQALEFATLVASGAGAAGANSPILCNGANLAFTKKAWMESQSELREDLASGDDIFLLQSVKRRGGKIRFLKSNSAMVRTKGAKDLKEFIRQRQRWAGKATGYTDKMLIFTSLLIFSINTVIVTDCVLGFYSTQYWVVAVALFVIKQIIDLTFISNIEKFFSLRPIFTTSLLLSLIYPIYILSVALSGFVAKPKWK